MKKGEILEITVSVLVTADIEDQAALDRAAKSVDAALSDIRGLSRLIAAGSAQRLGSAVAIRCGPRRHLRRASHRAGPGRYAGDWPQAMGEPICTCSIHPVEIRPCPVHGAAKPS